MTTVQETRGVVLNGATVLLMGRLVRSDGELLLASEASALTYGVVARDPCCPGENEAVSGHESVALLPTDVLYEALQTDAAWDVDATGYNFRHEIDITTNDAFPDAGRSYVVRYELIPITGQPIVFRFLIEAI